MLEDAEAANDLTTDPATRVADAVSIASDFGAMWVLVAILQVVLRRRRPLEAMVRLAAAGAVSVAATRTLKHHFAVPRQSVAPAASTLARTPTSPGFPSGHTLAAFTSAIVIPASRPGRVAALGAASLVAWARVRVGHHRIADVVAGAGAGAVAGLVVRAALRAGRRRV